MGRLTAIFAGSCSPRAFFRRRALTLSRTICSTTCSHSTSNASNRAAPSHSRSLWFSNVLQDRRPKAATTTASSAAKARAQPRRRRNRARPASSHAMGACCRRGEPWLTYRLSEASGGAAHIRVNIPHWIASNASCSPRGPCRPRTSALGADRRDRRSVTWPHGAAGAVHRLGRYILDGLRGRHLCMRHRRGPERPDLPLRQVRSQLLDRGRSEPQAVQSAGRQAGVWLRPVLGCGQGVALGGFHH